MKISFDRPRRWRAQGLLVVALVAAVVAVRPLGAAGEEPTEYSARPIRMGVSISTTPSLPYIFAGTAGMRVRSLTDPGRKFILSNSHVLAAIGPDLCPGSAPLGTPVLQPGTLDIGSDPGNDPFYRVGQLADFMPLRRGVNLIDAAVASTTTREASTEILGIGSPNPALGIASPGMPVIKSGRTTGVTQGTVDAVNMASLVNLGPGCGVALFLGQIAITPGTFSTGGDSGSAILNADTLTPVGLLFAGSPSVTVANHLLFVYASLRVFVDSATGVAGPTSMEELAAEARRLAWSGPRVQDAMRVQARHLTRLLAIPGVTGVGVGRVGDSTGLVIYVERLDARTRALVPARLEGVDVRLAESGVFRLF